MSYPLYRRGTFAVLDGVSHPATYAYGDNYVHFRDNGKAAPHARFGPIPVEMCERVVAVQVYARYRGHGVLVDEVNDAGMARVMEAEWDGEWATINGFLQENKYEYYKSTDVRDLRDYYEKQTDLLFPRWRTAHFPRPIGGLPLTGGWGNGTPAVVDGRPRSGLLETEDGRVAQVTTRAEYLGHPCEVAGISHDGSVGLYYLGDPGDGRAEADGFIRADGRWTKTVHVYDLARYHEHHADLLFDQWRESSQLPSRG